MKKVNMFVHYVNWLGGVKIIVGNYAKSNDRRNGNAEKLFGV